MPSTLADSGGKLSSEEHRMCPSMEVWKYGSVI